MRISYTVMAALLHAGCAQQGTVPEYRVMAFVTLPKRTRSAFSLVEMVMVITIIGIIAAIAVPKLSTASRHTEAKALQASVTNIRRAIDRYFAEHNRFPGYDPGSGTPSGAKFPDQLMKFTDLAGNTSDTKSSVFRFGPYIRPPFPKNPTNDLDTVHSKATPGAADPADGSVGWIAVLSTGDFGISASDTEIEKVVGNVGAVAENVKALIKVR